MGGKHMTLITQQNMMSMAQSPDTPPEVLARLAREGNWGVQEALTFNYYTPPETLAWLGHNNKYTPVLMGVAMNIHTPPETLAWLAHVELSEVIERRIAENPSTPPETLAWLANSRISSIRRGAASNESTPPETLAWLAQSEKDLSVLNNVAKNKNTPQHSRFLILLEHPEWADHVV
jgi:hypothetical protein